jgi:hypothetical protein
MVQMRSEEAGPALNDAVPAVPSFVTITQTPSLSAAAPRPLAQFDFFSDYFEA